MVHGSIACRHYSRENSPRPEHFFPAGRKSFWPYETEPSITSSPYLFDYDSSDMIRPALHPEETERLPAANSPEPKLPVTKLPAKKNKVNQMLPVAKLSAKKRKVDIAEVPPDYDSSKMIRSTLQPEEELMLPAAILPSPMMPVAMGIAEVLPDEKPCAGYAEAMIIVSYRIQDRYKIAQGFKYLCGQGIHNYGSDIIKSVDWGYEIPVVGILRNNGQDLYTVTEVGKARHAVHTVKCSTTVVAGSNDSDGICQECKKQKHSFFKRCRSAPSMSKPALSPNLQETTPWRLVPTFY
jgi:hypothetical protein